MSFAILRATNLCLRGSRRKWRRVMDINDGAGLPSYMELCNLFYVFFILPYSCMYLFFLTSF